MWSVSEVGTEVALGWLSLHDMSNEKEHVALNILAVALGGNVLHVYSWLHKKQHDNP